MSEAESLLDAVRYLVRWDIYPARQRLAAIGICNAFVNGRLSQAERTECFILMEYLVAENTRLIGMLGIAELVDEKKGRHRSARGHRTPSNWVLVDELWLPNSVPKM